MVSLSPRRERDLKGQTRRAEESASEGEDSTVSGMERNSLEERGAVKNSQAQSQEDLEKICPSKYRY